MPEARMYKYLTVFHFENSNYRMDGVSDCSRFYRFSPRRCSFRFLFLECSEQLVLIHITFNIKMLPYWIENTRKKSTPWARMYRKEDTCMTHHCEVPCSAGCQRRERFQPSRLMLSSAYGSDIPAL